MEIDVSECCYYNKDNSPFCCELYDNECEAQNCYFQQLQQLKEHCKQVDETNKILYQEKCDLIKENEFNESQINDWIKQYKLAHQKYMKLQTENEELRARNSRGTLAFLEEDFKKEQKIKKYKQCLEEIEAICKVHTDFCKDNKKNCELCPHEPCEDILILEKIKEIKGE